MKAWRQAVGVGLPDQREAGCGKAHDVVVQRPPAALPTINRVADDR